MSEIIPEKYYRKLHQKVAQNLYEEKMLAPNDKVLIGLSGGKDSMVLVESLAAQKKHLPFIVDFIAVHVNVVSANYSVDRAYLTSFCEDLDIPLLFRDIDVDFQKDPKKAPCFVCSWYRRKVLFDITKELHCTKLALGHHMDDANATFLMNMIYHGSISSMPKKLKMFSGRIELIRPLLLLEESEIQLYADLKGYKKPEKNCPYNDETQRMTMKNLMMDMKKMNMHASKNIFRSTAKIYEEYLPYFEIKK